MALVGVALVGFMPTAATADAGSPALDPSFGGDGVLTTVYGGADGMVTTLVVQDDGKLVVAGPAGAGDFGLARFHVDGSPDTGFGDDGVVTTDFLGGYDYPSALTLQPDGKFVAAGSAPASSGDRYDALARYNPDGTLDATFGQGGKVTTKFPATSLQVISMVIQPDGRIVTASGDSVSSAGMLARYTSDGLLDPGFGHGGTAVISDLFIPTAEGPVVLQPDGKLIVGGQAKQSGPQAFALLRVQGDGSPDPTFGDNGVVTTDLGPGEDAATRLAALPDGRLLVGGFSSSGEYGGALVRYLPDGTLDHEFGTGGKVLQGVPVPYAFALQPDGRVLVGAGFRQRTGEADVGIARYDTGGALDASFGDSGGFTADLISGYDEHPTAIALQPDGGLLIAGLGRGADEDLTLLARLTIRDH